MARGSGKKRAHRSKRATKQFFSQGSQDGSANASGEGESSTAQNPPPDPSSSSCLEHRPPTQCQSQTAHDESKPKRVILPQGYQFVAPLLHRPEKLQFIKKFLWERAEKEIISHYRTAPRQATEELVAQFAFAYSIKPPGWTTRVWRVDPEIIRRVAGGLWEEDGLHNVFRANGTESTGLEYRDIVLTANKNQNLGDWEAAAHICNWFLRRASEYEDRDDIQQAAPTIIVGLIYYTYACKFRAYIGENPSFEERTYWDWFRFDRRTRAMPARQNLLVPDAGKVKDHFEDGSFYPDISDIESECQFEDCQAYLTEEEEQMGQASSSTLVPTTTTTLQPRRHDTAAGAAGLASTADDDVKGKGKAKATQHTYETLPGQHNIMNPTIGVSNPDVLLPIPPRTTTTANPTTSTVADTTTTTNTGDKKKKKKRKNRKRKNKNKKKKNDKGKEKATDTVDEEEEEEAEEDASVTYYSANNCQEDDDDDNEDEDDDDDDDEEEMDAEEAKKKLPSLYEQIMSSYAEYSGKKAEDATVKAALEALEEHRESLARSKAAAHERLQRELMAVLERVKDKPPRVRRAILAREHQRLLASETLAAARGAQELRPTSPSTARVEEGNEKEEEAAAAEAVVSAGAASAPLRRPRFNLGTDPGWMGDLERMQIQVLRVGGRGGVRGGGGGGEKKEEEK